MRYLAPVLSLILACGPDMPVGSDRDGEPAPSCHDVATAWCEREGCDVPADCHARMHAVCDSYPADAPQLQWSCLDALADECPVEGSPSACW
jgi:hypothetical protein